MFFNFQAVIATKWGTDGFESEEPIRPEFKVISGEADTQLSGRLLCLTFSSAQGEEGLPPVRNTVTYKNEPDFPEWKRNLVLIPFSYLVISISIGIVGVLILGSFWVEDYLTSTVGLSWYVRTLDFVLPCP